MIFWASVGSLAGLVIGVGLGVNLPDGIVCSDHIDICMNIRLDGQVYKGVETR